MLAWICSTIAYRPVLSTLNNVTRSKHHQNLSSSPKTKSHFSDRRLAFFFLYLVPWPIRKSLEPRHDKTNEMNVRPVKTQISLGICPVWLESWLCAQWVAKHLRFLHADSKASDQTGQMPSLIWVFAGRTLILLVLSCCGSLVLPINAYKMPDTLIQCFSLNIQ